jgi:hypothetical protein
MQLDLTLWYRKPVELTQSRRRRQWRVTTRLRLASFMLLIVLVVFRSNRIQFDAISGDNGQMNTLGTFNALFPRGAYFGPKFALIGPANLLAVQPQFIFRPLKNVTGALEEIWFWRESTKDALYTFGNAQLRPANLTDARYIGSQPNLEIRWAINEHFLGALNLAGFVTGTFLQKSPPSNDTLFLNAGFTSGFEDPLQRWPTSHSE